MRPIRDPQDEHCQNRVCGREKDRSDRETALPTRGTRQRFRTDLQHDYICTIIDERIADLCGR